MISLTKMAKDALKFVVLLFSLSLTGGVVVRYIMFVIGVHDETWSGLISA